MERRKKVRVCTEYADAADALEKSAPPCVFPGYKYRTERTRGRGRSPPVERETTREKPTDRARSPSNVNIVSR